MDKTVVRDTIAVAIDLTAKDLAERTQRGTMINTRDDAFRLFYWFMMELSEASESNRYHWLRALLSQTEQPL